MDQRTRELMMMHKALHPRNDVDRLCLEKKGGGGFFRIEDSVDTSIRQLKDCIKKSKESLSTAIRNNTNNTRIYKTKITRKQKWEEKQLYGYFKQQTSKISHEKIWIWVRKGNIKRETKSLLITAQNNAIRTNYVKAKLDKTRQNSRSRLCGDRDETINHIISECNKLAQKEYKTWHDLDGGGVGDPLGRSLNLPIRTNGICTTQNPSRRMRRTNFSGILRYKRIT